MTLLEIAFIVLLALKLANVVDWSWWIIASLILVPLVFFGIFYIVAKFQDWEYEKKKWDCDE